MRTITRVAATLTGATVLGLGLVAAPANAAVGDPPTIEVPTTEFKAGTWGDGVEITVSDVPEEAETVTVNVGSMGENGGGLAGQAEATDNGDGTYTGTVIPEQSPVAPDANGYPKYTATGVYSYVDDSGEEQFVSSEGVELTITEGMSVTGPNEATVAELAAGVTLQFAGFQPDETLTGDIEYYNTDVNEWESIGDFSATVGPNGGGEGTLTVTGASVGDQFRVTANGAEGSVMHWITVVEGSDDDGGDDEGDDEGDDPAPEDPKKPERVDTGA